MIFIVGGKGLTGSVFVRHFEKNHIEFKIIQKENKEEFFGKNCDKLIFANGNALKYKANEDPYFDFISSVKSISEYIHKIKFKQFIHLSTIDVYHDKSNLKNLGATFNYGAEKIYNSMGKDAATLVKRSININPHSVYNVILQSTNREAKKNSNGYNFLKINYSNVMGDLAKFDNLQKNVWGNFVSKEMNKNNGSQVLWTTARKVSPNGNGYNWNYITIDGYESYDDLLSPEWNSNTKFPADLSKINSMMQGENFYKQVVWKIVMSVDSEGNFKEH